VSYGADYPVDGLVKRIEAPDIIVPLFSIDPEPGQTTVGFQREFVWKKHQSDRFVESLLLGLPVPGVFLVKEPTGSSSFSMGNSAWQRFSLSTGRHPPGFRVQARGGAAEVGRKNLQDARLHLTAAGSMTHHSRHHRPPGGAFAGPEQHLPDF